MTLYISALGRLRNIGASGTFEIIEHLLNNKIINSYTALRLTHAVACHIRLAACMRNETRTDAMANENDYLGKGKVYQLLEDVNLTSLVKSAPQLVLCKSN